MFAGILSRKSPSAVPAIASPALPITSATARTLRNAMPSTTVTARNAIAPRFMRSLSCLSSSTDSSAVTRHRTPAGSSAESSRSASRTPRAVLMASEPASRPTVSASAVLPFTRKKRPRESSSGRTCANSPSRNTRPPRPGTGRSARSSSAPGWSRSTTSRLLAPIRSAPNDCTMRASRIALLSAAGSTPTCRRNNGSYETLAPNSVPPPTETPDTPFTALKRGVKISSATR